MVLIGIIVGIFLTLYLGPPKVEYQIDKIKAKGGGMIENITDITGKDKK